MSRDGVYVCADIGCHWLGDWKRMEWMIERCAYAGVDAVKLQMFDAELLEGQYSQEMQEKLCCMTLTAFDVSNAVRCAHRHGIELVVTPMSKGLADTLKDVPVDGLKVRAKDYLNAPLVRAVRSFGKPYYISFPVKDGIASVPMDEKGQPVNEEDAEVLREHWFNTYPPRGHRVYCIPKYPPELSEIQLKTLSHQYHGFSNHYPHISVPLMAAALGIQNQMNVCRLNRFYLEVHARPDVGEKEQYLDWNVSLSFHQIRCLCKSVAIMEEAIG